MPRSRLDTPREARSAWCTGISPSFARSAITLLQRLERFQAGDVIAIVELEREFGRAEGREKYHYLAGLSPAGRAPSVPKKIGIVLRGRDPEYNRHEKAIVCAYVRC